MHELHLKWRIGRDMRKTVMMLVSFLSPKCNHNKLPLWGTDTFDLYFFMIHVCIYCCAVAHMDNTVPHVWISLNSNRRLNSFLKLLLSLCTVFVSVAFLDIFMHRFTDKLIYILIHKQSWSLPWLTVFSCCWDWLAPPQAPPPFVLTARLDFAAPQKYLHKWT